MPPIGLAVMAQTLALYLLLTMTIVIVVEIPEEFA